MLNSRNKIYMGLAGVLLLYFALTQFYNAAIPFGKGPDELTHYLYALFIGQHGRLPATPAEREEVGTRAYLPPLYHLPVGIAMAATQPTTPAQPWSATDTGLIPPLKVTWEPPTRQLIDIVLPRATLIRTMDERPPFRGEYLAWAVGRWVSALLGAGTIILTFFAARILLPHRPGFALAAASLMAFMPMALFIGAVLNDDNMIGLIMAGYLLLLVRFLRGKDSLWLYVGMGFMIGLGVTTKYTAGFLALGTAATLWLVRTERGWNLRALAGRVALVWGAVLLGSGWWFAWNEIRFNEIAEHGLIAGTLQPFSPEIDPTASRLVSFFSPSVSDPGLPTNGITGNFWDWLRRSFETTWAITVFGVSPYPAYWPIITLLAGLVLLSLAGLWGTFKQGNRARRVWIGSFLLHFVLVLPLPLVRFFLTYRINDTAQGRHLFFPVAPIVIILLLIGWDYWLKKSPRKKWAASLGLGLLLAWAVLHGLYLWRAYPSPLPVRTTPGPQMEVAHSTQINFSDILQLAGYQTERVNGGSILKIDLGWRVLTQAQEDYRTQITLVDSQNQPQLRWVSHPANGRFPVRAWQPGDVVRDTLYIPLVGLPAGNYQLQLRLLGWDAPLVSAQGETITLTTVTLKDTSQVTGPILWQQAESLNEQHPANSFAHSLTACLLGIRSFAYSPQVGVYRYRATIPVTAVPAAEVRLRGPNGQLWQPVTKTGHLRVFVVDYNWPSGTYRVQLDGDDTPLSLQVENFEWDFSPPEMMYTVNANFNNELLLLGYDLPTRRVEAGGGVPLVLYWQSLRQMRKSYIIFDRLLDVNRQSWGGYDRLPKETYPTNLWVPGEVVTDGFAVPVDADTPDGIYNIVVGLYAEDDPAARSLPLYKDGQPLDATSVNVGQIKVGDAPPGAVLPPESAMPDTPLAVELGQPPAILLRGYTLTHRDDALQLALYWQSLSPTPTNWSIFVHLRNQAGETVAQEDGPAGSGRYPSSLWDAGEIVVDTLHLPLAGVGPGQYTLVTGLYRVIDGQRLAVPEQQNSELPLTEIEVTP